VQAARRAAREGRFSEVIEICDAAEQIREFSEPGLEGRERIKLRRWLFLLRGEALLARRAWEDALAPLEAAVACARLEGDAAAVARCLGSLGRAFYRLGRFADAAPLLQESLDHADQGAPERASATRALADIEMRLGKIESAETLWEEALRVSMDIGSRDAEARARRGLAHLRAIQGRLGDAGDLLTQADDLLNPDGDYRVRAGVLARAVELDTAAGRLGSALYRAELLVELARRHGMGDRLPEAYALLATILAALGDPAEARDAAHQALVFSRAAASPGWDARVRAARVLLDLDQPAEALDALPAPEELPQGRVYDPPAQVAALRARLVAMEDPSQARDLAAWALTRPAPLLVLAAARISLDAAIALMAAAQPDAARQAVKRGLKLVQGGSESDGLRLELLVTMHAAGPDERVMEAIKLVVARMLPLLPAHTAERFRARPVVRDALRG
jgi:tetratricopeptide (TPR) repeat protein